MQKQRIGTVWADLPVQLQLQLVDMCIRIGTVAALAIGITSRITYNPTYWF